MTKLSIREAQATDQPALVKMCRHYVDPPAAKETRLVAEVRASTSNPAALVGCVRVNTAIGLVLPRYWYHLGVVVHAAQALGLLHRERTLLLCNDYTGASEIACLAGRPDAFALLLRAALLVLARSHVASGARDAGMVIAELPGLRDTEGASPFWQGFGRYFYSGDPHEAASKFGAAWRTYVAALLPRDPLIASFLSPSAQAALGQVPESAAAQASALHAAGLRAGRYVTIDEGGAVFEAGLSDLLSAAGAALLTLREAETLAQAQRWLVLRNDRVEFAQVRAMREGATLHVEPSQDAPALAAAAGPGWACPWPEQTRL
jgi:arginine N-succinyltransferase